MPTPIFSSDLGSLVLELAGMMGDNLHDGTAESTFATNTLVDTDMVDADDSRLKGRHIYVYDGVAAGDKRRASAFTAGSDTLGVTPVLSATPDGTTKFLVTEQWSGYEYERALQAAQQLIGGNLNFKEDVDRSIITGNPLLNANLHLWTAGTSSAPDDWTLGGSSAAVAQETIQVRMGEYSAKITSASAEATLSQSIKRIGRFRGQTLSLKGWVWNNTAGEVAIRLTDGVTTESKDNSGSSNWEYLETDPFTVTANASELTASFRVDTGTKVGYVSALWLPVTMPNEYSVDTSNNFVKLDGYLGLSDPISTSNGAGGDNLGEELGPTTWDVYRWSGERRIRIDADGISNRVLSIRGWVNHSELTSATVAWTGNPQALLWRAKELLHRGRGQIDEAILAQRMADTLEQRFARQPLKAPKTWEPN